MVDPQLVERLRQDPHAMQAGPFGDSAGFGSPLRRIEALAYAIGHPAVLAEASEILVTVAKSAGPSRDEIAEAVEDVCGEELGGCCVNRIADAVMRLCQPR